MPVTGRVKAFTRFVEKYVTGRMKRFRLYMKYIYSWSGSIAKTI